MTKEMEALLKEADQYHWMGPGRASVNIVRDLAAALRQLLSDQSATDKELREALEAIYTSARGDEKGQGWAIRKFLDDRDIFNDDIQGTKRLIEMACKHVLEPKS